MGNFVPLEKQVHYVLFTHKALAVRGRIIALWLWIRVWMHQYSLYGEWQLGVEMNASHFSNQFSPVFHLQITGDQIFRNLFVNLFFFFG